ncbi:hypothetical protein [Poritiphilus flavus]|uniref:Uncharacterized protein n=1 Tax=Poritiphilus flavus TaxID=2697053 RepID=A0A6L9EG59_9FLAO|nr:hypothetical protein [Poritiphilus flavus]NAS13632.1 hypothetical protein [Poritiphilus flavus]
MNSILKLFTLNRCLALTIGVLISLIVLNFYGLYTNKFYLVKFDNYIFPLLTIIHFTYLYVLRFKIREEEYTDPAMRNLEYALYAIFLIYLFKASDTFYILMSYKDYEDHILPGTFLPMGILIFCLQLSLMALTVLVIWHRKNKVGDYNFDNINENIDPWP